MQSVNLDIVAYIPGFAVCEQAIVDYSTKLK